MNRTQFAALRAVPSHRALDRPRWMVFALTVTCLLAGVLYCWGIGSSWGNSYYSAAVKSMSRSWENFVFGAFDPAGVITVDKPPMALWAQVLSVKAFGYNEFAVLFPQALAGVAAVLLLHRTVRRWAGEHAALVAALVMALTPITVAINRDNNPDTLLVLLVVAAAYAMTRAIESETGTWWLVLAAGLVGCGFLTKMLQAWLVLPAFVAAYLVGSRRSWSQRFAGLGMAAAALLAGSFWWVLVTAAWPGSKPFIGGSEDGSAWDLVFGYNGFGRIFGGEGNRGGGGPGGGGGFSGEPGIFRLFNEQLAGQISWLLPLCAVVLLSVAAIGVREKPWDRRFTAGWVLWGGWLIVIALMFSFAQGTMHPYYTTMLAPAVGAVSGSGLVLFWHRYRQAAGFAWIMLPLSVGATAVWAVVLVLRDPDWNGWAAWLASGLGVAAVAALLAGRRGKVAVAKSGLAAGLAAALAVPTVWSVEAAVAGSSNMGGANPTAGPSVDMFGGGPPGSRGRGPVPPNGPGPGTAMPSGGSPSGEASLSDEQRALLDYVSQQAGKLRVPLAIEGGAHSASSYIINSEATVVGMGGFTGSDDAPSVAQLTEWKRKGQLGFVLLRGKDSGGPGGPPGRGGDTERDEWVQQNCTTVDFSSGDSMRLYRCR